MVTQQAKMLATKLKINLKFNLSYTWCDERTNPKKVSSGFHTHMYV